MSDAEMAGKRNSPEAYVRTLEQSSKHQVLNDRSPVQHLAFVEFQQARADSAPAGQVTNVIQHGRRFKERYAFLQFLDVLDTAKVKVRRFVGV
mmetsp:Transcript_15164/g.34980  ORF Transcript_15164/g.34980 Transcript_15164/m.34980 type:complete len:93 (+) Transcript_15164:151-429(+)